MSDNDRERPPAVNEAGNNRCRVMEGFLSFMEGATLEWLTHKPFPRDTMKALLVAAAPAALAAAEASDSTLRFDLTFAPAADAGKSK